MLGRALHLGLLLCAYHLETHHLTFKFVFCEICLDREALRCGPTSPGQAPGCLLHTQGLLQGVHRCRENQVDAGALGHLRAGPRWGWRAQGEERCPVFLQVSGRGSCQVPGHCCITGQDPGPQGSALSWTHSWGPLFLLPTSLSLAEALSELLPSLQYPLGKSHKYKS